MHDGISHEFSTATQRRRFIVRKFRFSSSGNGLGVAFQTLQWLADIVRLVFRWSRSLCIRCEQVFYAFSPGLFVSPRSSARTMMILGFSVA